MRGQGRGRRASAGHTAAHFLPLPVSFMPARIQPDALSVRPSPQHVCTLWLGPFLLIFLCTCMRFLRRCASFRSTSPLGNATSESPDPQKRQRYTALEHTQASLPINDAMHACKPHCSLTLPLPHSTPTSRVNTPHVNTVCSKPTGCRHIGHSGSASAINPSAQRLRQQQAGTRHGWALIAGIPPAAAACCAAVPRAEARQQQPTHAGRPARSPAQHQVAARHQHHAPLLLPAHHALLLALAALALAVAASLHPAGAACRAAGRADSSACSPWLCPGSHGRLPAGHSLCWQHGCCRLVQAQRRGVERRRLCLARLWPLPLRHRGSTSRYSSRCGDQLRHRWRPSSS